MNESKKGAQDAPKVENVVVVETVESLINAINAKAVTAEQFATMKSLIETGKLVINSDTLPILQYVAKGFQKIVAEGNSKAAKDEAKKLAEETYKTDVQKYEIELAAKFAVWSNGLIAANTVKNETDPKLAFVRISKEVVKTSFAEFLKSLPTEPKKPGVSGTSKKSSNVSNYYDVKPAADVTKLEGLMKVIFDLVTEKQPMKKSDLKKAILAAKHTNKKGTEYTEGAIGVAIERALNGRLPIVEVDGLISIKVAK